MSGIHMQYSTVMTLSNVHMQDYTLKVSHKIAAAFLSSSNSIIRLSFSLWDYTAVFSWCEVHRG